MNTKPKHGQDASADDSEVTEPVSVAGSGGDRKWHMKVGTNRAIQHGRYSITDACDQRDEYGIGGG